MEAKLIKKSENYYELYEVRTNLTLLIGSTDSEKKIDVYGKDAHKLLSLKNCQAIELGYDLDKLTEDYLTLFPEKTSDPDRNFVRMGMEEGFKEGLQKALEILGDKKFSEKDMIKALSAGLSIGYGRQFEIENKQVEIDSYIKSLQQTEWDVSVVTELAYTVNENSETEMMPEPHIKLDADGCLILKRK